jgi:hypothetical protein
MSESTIKPNPWKEKNKISDLIISLIVINRWRKRSLVRLRKRWEDYINADLGEIHCEDGRWLELAHDCVQWQALVSAVLKLCILLP